jgi:hypothetical protein
MPHILIFRLLLLPLCVVPSAVFLVLHFHGVRDGLVYYCDLPQWFAALLALTLGYVPLFGSIMGYLTAVNLWEWPRIWAFAVFLWYVPLAVIVIAVKLGFILKRKAEERSGG